MNAYATLFVLACLALTPLLGGCGPKQGNDVCNAACAQQGFTSGSCREISVVQNPCEQRYNQTTIYSQDGYCPDTHSRGFGPFKTHLNGVGDGCCCTS